MKRPREHSQGITMGISSTRPEETKTGVKIPRRITALMKQALAPAALATLGVAAGAAATNPPAAAGHVTASELGNSVLGNSVLGNSVLGNSGSSRSGSGRSDPAWANSPQTDPTPQPTPYDPYSCPACGMG